MNKQTNKQRKRSPRRSPGQTDAVRFPLPFVMLLSWMRSYAGEEECSCGASPDYEIDSFVDAEGLLEADGPIEKDQMLLSALEEQRSGAFAVYQTFLTCRQHALQLFTDLYGEQDAQQALSPLLLGVSNLTVTVGREITNAKSPCGTLRVSYTNATTISEVIEAHTGYAVAEIQEGNGRHRSEARLAPQVLQHVEAAHPGQVQAQDEQVGGSMPCQEAPLSTLRRSRKNKPRVRNGERASGL